MTENTRWTLIAGVVALLVIAFVAVFELGAGIPIHAQCADEGCKEGREWISAILTFLVVGGGLFHYLKAQRWKRAEWVAAEADAFFDDKKVMNALQMLDWNARRLLLLLDARESEHPWFEYDADQLVEAFYSKSTIPKEPMTKKDHEFSEIALAIRDSFDRMLGRLERFEIFIERGLVTFAELKPYLEYWIEIIGDKHYGVKDTEIIERLWTYIDDYGFTGVQHLCRRFGFEITPSESIVKRLVVTTMDATDLRRQIKAAVSNWSGVAASEIRMTSKLDDLASVDREILRQRVNQEFAGQNGIPISGKVWSETEMTTVGDVRDLVRKQIEG